MTTDLVTALLPVLNRSSEARFNVFDVMHHGTHEKQLSNVFGWLLNGAGSHGLADTFLRIFVEEVNAGLVGGEPFTPSEFLVMQEVNTSADEGQDIADLVLENDREVIVVEHYLTSDGHGHSYDSYRAYSQRDGRHGAVVLLCQDHDSSLQTLGWENASVVTYSRLVDRLWQSVADDARYQHSHPEPFSFIDQMQRKFVQGRDPVGDQQVLDFAVAMCATDQAGRYGTRPHDTASERFANDVAEQARERFEDGRELLMRVKHRVTNYASQVLRAQLNETFGEDLVSSVGGRYVGNYQWTVKLARTDGGGFQIKFGPSAWFANNGDPYWKVRVDPETADYAHLFITEWPQTDEVRQSVVTIQEVLDGLAPSDRRLHDELVQLARDAHLLTG